MMPDSNTAALKIHEAKQDKLDELERLREKAAEKLLAIYEEDEIVFLEALSGIDQSGAEAYTLLGANLLLVKFDDTQEERFALITDEIYKVMKKTAWDVAVRELPE